MLPDASGSGIKARPKDAKRKRTATEEVASDVGKKRARWKPPLGRLAKLPDMCTDILFDIFSHLLPNDILQLSRTSKDFRRLLMHRSAAWVWKMTLTNIPGFPECPDDLTEPQWVHLAFDQRCHSCGTPKIRVVQWALRVRFCQKCLKIRLVERSRNFMCDVFGAILGDLLPSVPGKKYYSSPLFLKDSVEDIQNLLTPTRQTSLKGEERATFIQQRLEGTKKIKSHAKICEQWARGQASDRTQELDGARKDRMEAIQAKLKALGWEDVLSKMTWRETEEFERHKLVKEPKRLTERIWNNIRGPLVEHMEQVKAKVLERDRKALVFARKRIAIEVLRTYKNQCLPYTQILPGPPDFCDIPEIRDIIELPSDVPVDESSFSQIAERLPALSEAWASSIHEKLLEHLLVRKEAKYLLPRTSEGVPENVADLDADALRDFFRKSQLATTVYKCSDCQEPFDLYRSLLMFWDDMEQKEELFDFGQGVDLYQFKNSSALFYPRVLAHKCLVKKVDHEIDASDPALGLPEWTTVRQKWSPDKLKVDERTGIVVARIVVACGLDPKTATAQDMDALDVRLACLACTVWPPSAKTDVKPSTMAMDWRGAVKHQVQFHNKFVPWFKIADEEAQALKLVEEQVAAGDETISCNVPTEWGCSHCRDLPVEPDLKGSLQIRAHLAARHGISDPKINVDYFKDLDTPPNAVADGLYPRHSHVTIPP
ncbi:hypothetical protein JAAARDRAFT_156921 [Jaapia argillacea MUCL 33604]|uniref:F-box domain-containing protein n=1 Tax=Jaapia argillacea MUCL 33604 TaxID=933084 RepID=A0A067Q5I5_9AGAM|nr:hypothetical protein JAAARDRAFT_156921 [Jaapia argillacea MUCL 33604]